MVNIAIGLFDPNRYRIEKHNEYDITRLKDNYRSLNIMKSRDGISNKKLPLFFNGAVDFFKEMPRPDEVEKMNKVYELITKISK